MASPTCNKSSLTSISMLFLLPTFEIGWIIGILGNPNWSSALDHRYTRSEVERMVGISRRELNYWTRLRLVIPRARWGERFFSFSDLVALETIKRLAGRRVPAGRIRRAVTALESELGVAQTPLSLLRISTNGKQVVVYPPLTDGKPYE